MLSSSLAFCSSIKQSGAIFSPSRLFPTRQIRTDTHFLTTSYLCCSSNIYSEKRAYWNILSKFTCLIHSQWHDSEDMLPHLFRSREMSHICERLCPARLHTHPPRIFDRVLAVPRARKFRMQNFSSQYGLLCRVLYQSINFRRNYKHKKRQKIYIVGIGFDTDLIVEKERGS